MPQPLHIGLAQLDPIVGDVDGNLAKIRAARMACAPGCDLVVFSELVTVGYPPEDLILRPAVVGAARRAVEALAADTRSGSAMLVTTPWEDGGVVYNAVVLLAEGRIAATRYKHELPNYGVFDEKRVFASGPLPSPIEFQGTRLGVMICEDMWFPRVADHLAAEGAQILIVPNGSPFERGKVGQRVALAVERTRETGLPLVYTNQVGGQDELVFDGGSFVVNADGSVVVRMPFWTEAVQDTQWTRMDDRLVCGEQVLAPLPAEPSNTYQALMLGLRDYVNKNRFPGVLLGLSGGIDSALTAVIAVDALGPERVRAVRLPSRFTSEASQDDADLCAKRLGIQLDTVPIGDIVDAIERTLAPVFDGRPRDITEENVQARARGLLLMAMSNKFSSMLLTTGNKSDVGRIRDTVRRHVRGLLGAQGSVQDRGVRADRMAERLRAVRCARPQGRGSSREHHYEGADRRVAGKSERPGHAAGVRRARRDAERPRRAGAQRRRHRGGGPLA